MDKFELSIVTPDKKLLEESVQEVIVPGKEGEMAICPRHAPLLAALGKGKIIVKGLSGTKEFDIENGFIEIHENKTTILAR